MFPCTSYLSKQHVPFVRLVNPHCLATSPASPCGKTERHHVEACDRWAGGTRQRRLNNENKVQKPAYYLHIASLLCWMIGQLIAPCSSYYSPIKTSELWCFGLLFPLGLYLSRRDGFRNATINRTRRHPSAFLAILWCLCQEMYLNIP